MPGLDPGIHPSSQKVFSKKMDCRVKPGNDEGGHSRESRGEIAGNCLCGACCLKCESNECARALTSPRLRGEVGGRAQRSLRATGTICVAECVESPLTRNSRDARISTSPRKRGEVRQCAGSRQSHSAPVCAGARNRGDLFLPKTAVDFPVSAASTRATMCSRRSSLASLLNKSRPKITLSVALFER
jgi:hypothetical protein